MKRLSKQWKSAALSELQSQFFLPSADIADSEKHVII